MYALAANRPVMESHAGSDAIRGRLVLQNRCSQMTTGTTWYYTGSDRYACGAASITQTRSPSSICMMPRGLVIIPSEQSGNLPPEHVLRSLSPIWLSVCAWPLDYWEASHITAAPRINGLNAQGTAPVHHPGSDPCSPLRTTFETEHHRNRAGAGTQLYWYRPVQIASPSSRAYQGFSLNLHLVDNDATASPQADDQGERWKYTSVPITGSFGESLLGVVGRGRWKTPCVLC
ncbi:hypothetical protein C8Q80DRAFT_1126942 [Daedaleopsis nitida]|nr:hypothetical protein C8Q80DRAFT_1126942 [Daedaleopsis nitida]